MRANRTKRKERGGQKRRSLITMDWARNPHPPIPWAGYIHCHDVYEVHAATLWGIRTCVSVLHIDWWGRRGSVFADQKTTPPPLTCKSGQRFPLAELHMRSSVHGRTSRRSQVCAVHSVLSTATSTRLARP